MQTIRAIAAEAENRPPTQSEVERMRDLASEINDAITGRVNEEGQITKPE
jgi:hypothetical protein